MAASVTSLLRSRHLCFLLLLYVFLFECSPQKRSQLDTWIAAGPVCG